MSHSYIKAIGKVSRIGNKSPVPITTPIELKFVYEYEECGGEIVFYFVMTSTVQLYLGSDGAILYSNFKLYTFQNIASMEYYGFFT